MQNTLSSSSNNIVYTVLVNGTTSALTVTIAGNVATAADISNTVSVSKGDQLTLQVIKGSIVTPAVQQIVVSLEFV